MPIESHVLMDGALHVYCRESSRYWQCSTYLGSLNHRQTTKEVSRAAAKDFARDWYMERCVEDRQRRRGGAPMLDGPVQPLIAGPGALADGRLGERNAEYVKSKSDHIRVHLLPFFGDTALEDITAGKIQEYRFHRQTSRIDRKTGKPKKPARATLHGEMVTLRQVLKTANRKGWIAALRAGPQAQAAESDRSHIWEVAARADEHGPRRAQSEVRSRWACPHLLQLAAYLYLPSIARRGGHLSGRQELPHQRGNDREILWAAFEEQHRRIRRQCPQGAARAGKRPKEGCESYSIAASLCLPLRVLMAKLWVLPKRAWWNW